MCTGVIGRRIKLQPLLDSVPKLVANLGASVEDAHHAAVGITTTDLVSKSAAIEVKTTKAKHTLRYSLSQLGIIPKERIPKSCMRAACLRQTEDSDAEALHHLSQMVSRTEYRQGQEALTMLPWASPQLYVVRVQQVWPASHGLKMVMRTSSLTTVWPG